MTKAVAATNPRRVWHYSNSALPMNADITRYLNDCDAAGWEMVSMCQIRIPPPKIIIASDRSDYGRLQAQAAEQPEGLMMVITHRIAIHEWERIERERQAQQQQPPEEVGLAIPAGSMLGRHSEA